MHDQNIIPVGIFRFPTCPANLVSALQSAPAYEHLSVSDIANATNFILAEEASIFLVYVNSKDDLFQLAVLTKEIKARSCLVKIVVVSQRSSVFDKALAKLGVVDIIDSNSSTKAIRYKIDLWSKSLKTQLKKKQERESLRSGGAQDVGASAELRAAEHLLLWQEPLTTDADMWLLRSEADCRKVMTKWLVRILGPSPYVGRWVDAPRIGGWEFKFKTETNPYCPPGARWFFRGGQKPEFVWKDNLWLLASDSFSLYCELKNETFTRISLKSRVLTIARNSVHALSKEAVLLESFSKDLVVNPDADGDEEFLDPAGMKRFEYLKGKTKGEGPIEGHLYGKQKQAGEAQSGPLTGKARAFATVEVTPDEFLEPDSDGNMRPAPSRAALTGNLKGKDGLADRLSTYYGAELKSRDEKVSPTPRAHSSEDSGQADPEAAVDADEASEKQTKPEAPKTLSSKDKPPRPGAEPRASVKEKASDLKGKSNGTDHLSTYLGKTEAEAVTESPPDATPPLSAEEKEQKKLREVSAKKALVSPAGAEETLEPKVDGEKDSKKASEASISEKKLGTAEKMKALSEKETRAASEKAAATPSEIREAAARSRIQQAAPEAKTPGESPPDEVLDKLLKGLPKDAAGTKKQALLQKATGKSQDEVTDVPSEQTGKATEPKQSRKGQLPGSTEKDETPGTKKSAVQALEVPRLLSSEEQTGEPKNRGVGADGKHKLRPASSKEKTGADGAASTAEAGDAPRAKPKLELLLTQEPGTPPLDPETAKRLKVLFEKAAKQYKRG